MLYNAESDLYRSMGAFSTVPQLSFPKSSYGNGYVNDSYSFAGGSIPSQCAAFLTSNYAFTLFVENWEINRESGNPVFQNKKTYPIKVTGLNIPYYRSQTFKWKEGLIDNSFNQLQTYQSYFRPGFGQTILSDLQRPFISTTVTKNTLGLSVVSEQEGQGFVGPFGRLMSMAFWVDPELAKKYDNNKSKKKKKSLNEQDYQQMPQYPTYTPYQNNSGY